MRTVRTLSMVLVFVMVFSGMAMAGKFGGHRGGHDGHRGGHGFMGPRSGHGFIGLRALMRLGLSDAQKTEVANVIKKHRDDIKNATDKLIEAKKNLSDVIHADEFSEADVRQAFQQVTPIKEEFVVLRAKIFSELKSVLTTEQIKVLKERKAKRGENKKERMEEMWSGFDAWLESQTSQTDTE